MIIELVGLPGSGKTSLAGAMKTHGVVLVPLPSRERLLMDALLFWLEHPISAFRLAVLVCSGAPRGVRYGLFVNGYLGYAARYRTAQLLSQQGKIAVLDQGFSQLLISLHGLPSALLKKLPKPDVLVVVSADATERERRMAERGWAPRENFGHDIRLAWQHGAEEAFQSELPSLEGLTKVYRYDGMQSPQEGAQMLMEFVTRQTKTTERTLSVRSFLKTVLAMIAFVLVRFVRIFSRTPEVIVLMYHAIDRSGWKLAVAPEEFERQMQYLSQKGYAVSLHDVVDYVKGGKTLPAHAVAVTFDDGYRDLLATVLPVLERYQIPATVFLPSDLSVQTDPNGKAHLTREEVRVLAESPLITIGSHARTHRKFTKLSFEEMLNESETSALELEKMSGRRPRFFAYPFGARSLEAERAVREAGYEAAFGITEGTIRRGDNLFVLQRVQIDATMNFLLFRLRLTSAVDWNRRVVDTLRALMPI